jgi:hypothetical protein
MKERLPWIPGKPACRTEITSFSLGTQNFGESGASLLVLHSIRKADWIAESL